MRFYSLSIRLYIVGTCRYIMLIRKSSFPLAFCFLILLAFHFNGCQKNIRIFLKTFHNILQKLDSWQCCLINCSVREHWGILQFVLPTLTLSQCESPFPSINKVLMLVHTVLQLWHSSVDQKGWKTEKTKVCDHSL